MKTLDERVDTVAGPLDAPAEMDDGSYEALWAPSWTVPKPRRQQERPRAEEVLQDEG